MHTCLLPNICYVLLFCSLLKLRMILEICEDGRSQWHAKTFCRSWQLVHKSFKLYQNDSWLWIDNKIVENLLTENLKFIPTPLTRTPANSNCFSFPLGVRVSGVLLYLLMQKPKLTGGTSEPAKSVKILIRRYRLVFTLQMRPSSISRDH